LQLILSRVGDAALFLGGALQLRLAAEAVLAGAEAREQEVVMVEVRRRLGEARFSASAEAGGALDKARLIECALERVR
jgi:hypothetical protein